MKTFVAASFIMTAFLFNSCGPAATFDKPQPDNTKPLTSFPERILGKYLSLDQASILTVSDKLLTRHYDFDFKEHKDSIGTSYKLIGDTLINLKDSTGEKVSLRIVSLKGDTIILHANWTDTLFNISVDNILKKFKGHYFLNIHQSDNAWEVKKLSLKKGLLTVGSISAIEDIRKLKEVTETTADTTSTHFGLTRRQFKNFVKQQGFSDEQTFTRMTENGR